MMRRLISLLILAAALPPPVAARAGHPLSAATSPARSGLPNDVTCVFAALGAEEREIALMLIVDELEHGKPDHTGSPLLAEVDAMLAAAHDRCIDAYPWTAGRSANAVAWTSAALYREANAQAVSNSGQDPQVVADWFTAHRAEIGAGHRRAVLWFPALNKYLAGLGWGDASSPAVGFADLYLGEMAAQELMRRNFGRGVFEADD